TRSKPIGEPGAFGRPRWSSGRRCGRCKRRGNGNERGAGQGPRAASQRRISGIQRAAGRSGAAVPGRRRRQLPVRSQSRPAGAGAAGGSILRTGHRARAFVGRDAEGHRGLGELLPGLGEYEKSKAVFEKGTALFPDNRAIQVFFAMTLYNLQEHRRAMELLLRCLLDTTGDDAILGYKKAIAFYAERLDETWAGWWPELAITISDSRRHGRASSCQRRKIW